MNEILDYVFSKNTLLAILSFVIGSYIIFYKFNDSRYIWLYIGLLVVFYYFWDDQDKNIWFLIFIQLSITMIVMENLVVHITNGAAITYNSANIFKNIPYWLPIAYWNSILFVVYHYRLYKIIIKTLKNQV
jgi:hypothetical protein